jgi:peptidoglycan/xylan/chitin deacetylase (PgdA/CDA1 family)
LIVAVLLAAATFWQPPPRTIAVTIDDLPTPSVVGNDLQAAEQTTKTLLAALRRHGVPAIGFVNEQKLQPAGAIDPRRVALLEQWLEAGLELGNHTFSHPDLHGTPIDAFKNDVMRGDVVIRRLLAARGRKPEYFRHPFLHTGRTLDIKRSLEDFLSENGYRVAPITIDNYDYVFAAAYDRAGARNDTAAQGRVVSAYLEYMDSIVSYYEQQSVRIVGREIAQTLLLHASALNAATFDRLGDMLKKRGYRFVSLSEALTDPAYTSKDEYVGPAGMTWLHRWALTKGNGGSTFAGEPAVPRWIETYR